MKLSVDSLQQAGGFAGAPVEREVSWKVGKEEYTATVYVRKLSYHSAVGDIRAIANHEELAAARIANCIVDEEGKPVFQVSDVTGVLPDGTPVMTVTDGQSVERGPMIDSLVTALLVVIGEVNDLGKSIPTPQIDSEA